MKYTVKFGALEKTLMNIEQLENMIFASKCEVKTQVSIVQNLL